MIVFFFLFFFFYSNDSSHISNSSYSHADIINISENFDNTAVSSSSGRITSLNSNVSIKPIFFSFRKRHFQNAKVGLIKTRWGRPR